MDDKGPRQIRWLVWVPAGLLAVAVLANLGASGGAEREPGSPVAAPAPAADPVFTQLGTQQFWAMQLPAATPAADWLRHARAKCAGQEWCKVLGWTDPGAVPTAMPMTDRELAAQVFALTINRQSGADEASFNCGVFPDAPAEQCPKE